MDPSSIFATGILALVAAGWIFCVLASIVTDLRGSLIVWWSRVPRSTWRAGMPTG